MKNKFTCSHLITLGDTNAMGNVYFAEYFKLQGIVREKWLIEKVENAFTHLQNGLILSTVSAHCDYLHPNFVYDTVLCKMFFDNLKKTSVKINFEFYSENTNKLHATGWQKIVFQSSDRKICKIPEDFTKAINLFLIN